MTAQLGTVFKSTLLKVAGGDTIVVLKVLPNAVHLSIDSPVWFAGVDMDEDPPAVENQQNPKDRAEDCMGERQIFFVCF